MKTLVPNIDQMNDVSPPDDDNEPVDTEVRAHDSVEKVPHLPDISSSVVRRAVGTHARFITNSCLRTKHGCGRCKDIETISRGLLNKTDASVRNQSD